MSGISSGVGLISGIPIADLIDQLMQIEARPLETVQRRISTLETEKTAWMSLSASLLGLKLAAAAFEETDTFGVTKATSSDKTILTASAEVDANLGTYQFTVRRLVQAHQMISGGFADQDTTPVGAGTIYFDMGRGRVDTATELEFLNGQEGVRRGSIRITDWAGVTADVDLTEAMTVADVLEAINSETTLGVQASVSGGQIVLTNTTALGSGTITVGEVGNGLTAADLGILGSAIDSPLVGSDILAITADTSLDLLNDRNGIERCDGGTDISFTLRDSTTLDVKLYGEVVGEGDYTAYTVGDIIDAINGWTGNDGKLVAAISDDGRGIKLTDTTGVAGNLIVADGAGSSAATQLGIVGTYAGGAGDLEVSGGAVIAEINSVLIRNLAGGAGLTVGTLSLQDRSGASTTVDLTGLNSLSEIVEAINDNGVVAVQAAVNAVGNGLTLTDTSGASAANFVVADVSGNVAATLGIAVDDAVTEIAGVNAQHKYISTHTRLEDLPGSDGWTGGKFRITNSMGVSVDVNVSGSSVTRIENVLLNINGVATGIGVTARINDSGTGIILEDAAGGAMAMEVADLSGGRSAKLLNLRGEAAAGETFIDGSFHHAVTIDADDTLQDVADAINAADIGITAGIVNDGTATNPYRLILSSELTGKTGQILFDHNGTDLDATTFVEARDALVYLGSPGSANAVVLTSSTNQLADVISGVTLQLQGTDTDPVTLTVSRDTDAIAQRMQSFVESFNSIISNIDQYTRFNPDTMEKGILFGDNTVSVVRARLMNMVLNSVDVAGSYTRLSQVGFSMGTGNTLRFDRDKFLAAFADDRQGVIALFTQAAEMVDDEEVAGTGGIGPVFECRLDGLARDYDGFVARIISGLDSQTRSLERRTEHLNDILAGKRARLERQFAAMESALAQLQGQQSALASLSQMASSFRYSASSNR